MLRFVPFLFVALLSAAFPPMARAVQDFKASAQPASRLQLLVIEAPGCFYCSLFRHDVLTSYAASPWARDVPIRFLNLEAATTSALALRAPIDVVPTAVLLKDNSEVGRIPGYVGAEEFFHSINYLLSRVQ